MQVFSARVRGGAIVPEEGVMLPEGTQVTVSADDSMQGVEISPDEQRPLPGAIIETERD